MTASATLELIIELRKRAAWSLIFLGVLFSVTFFFANSLYTWLAFPLLKQFSSQQHLIATNILSSFFAPIELAFYAAIFLAMPFFLYHLWAFIAPALYSQERRIVWLLLLVSVVLFYAGIAFAYFVIFPVLFGFLVHAAPVGVQITPDINSYLEFTLRLFLIFGIIFEIPVIMIFLAKTNIITREKLIKSRSYVIVGAFIVAMLVAPPDILSQILVALPLWWLYEVGLVFLRILSRKGE
jgi:sec-independent protein translocase protein TatC